MKPATISVRCAYLFASRCAAKDETRMPTVAAVKTTPVPIALYPRTVCRKTETTNDTPMSSSHCVFCVTRAEIADAVPEQPGRQERLLPGPLP